MKKITSKLLAASFAACALFVGSAVATTYTWVPTAGGTYYWNDSANWVNAGGGNGGFPDAPGDEAIIDNAYTGEPKINLGQNITIGKLTLTGSGARIFLQNASNQSFSMTFDNAGNDAEITLGAIGARTHYMGIPIVLNSDMVIDLGGVDAANRHVLQIDKHINLQNHTITLVGGIIGQGQFIIGAINGLGDLTSGTIVNSSASTIQSAGNGGNVKISFPGTFILNRQVSGSNNGSLTCVGGGFSNFVEIVISGKLTNSQNFQGGSVSVGSGTSFGDNPSPRLSGQKITFHGGALSHNGQPAGAGSTPWNLGEEWCVENIGVMDFLSGYNFIKIGDNAIGVQINVGTMNRERGVSVFLLGKYFNTLEKDNSFLFVGNGTDWSKGAGGAAGTTKMSIIPWLSVNANTGDKPGANSLAFYDAQRGVRALADSEYVFSLTNAAAGDNVSITANSPFVSTNLTINSLKITDLAGTSYNDNLLRNGMKLKISSGGLLLSKNHTLGKDGNPERSIIDFGGEEGVITAPALVNTFIGYTLAGSNGFTKAHTGSLTLTATNSISGPIHVSGGVLRLGKGDVRYPSNLGTSDTVDIHAGATLRISTENAIDNTATVFIRSLVDDLYTGKIEIDAGFEERVKYLCIGGVGMPPGTYGSLASDAEYQMEEFFAGDGKLIVTKQYGEELNVSVIIVR